MSPMGKVVCRGAGSVASSWPSRPRPVGHWPIVVTRFAPGRAQVLAGGFVTPVAVPGEIQHRDHLRRTTLFVTPGVGRPLNAKSELPSGTRPCENSLVCG